MASPKNPSLVGSNIDATLMYLAPRLPSTISVTDSPGPSNAPEFCTSTTSGLALSNSAMGATLPASAMVASSALAGVPGSKKSIGWRWLATRMGVNSMAWVRLVTVT